MPDSDQVHFPHPTKKEVYWQYLKDRSTEESKQEEHAAVTYSHFMSTWKKARPMYKLRRLMRFTKCDTCTTLRETIRVSASVTVKDEARRKLQEHKDMYNKEKDAYYSRRAFARKNPDQAMSIIMDGSDMGSYGIPYFHENSKAQTGWKMRVGLMGVIVHGIHAACYLYHKHWSNDSNLAIEVIHRTLASIDNLPPLMYLQVVDVL